MAVVVPGKAQVASLYRSALRAGKRAVHKKSSTRFMVTIIKRLFEDSEVTHDPARFDNTMQMLDSAYRYKGAEGKLVRNILQIAEARHDTINRNKRLPSGHNKAEERRQYYSFYDSVDRTSVMVCATMNVYLPTQRTHYARYSIANGIK